MKKLLHGWKYLDLMCGANRKRLKLGETLTTCGLAMAAVGLVVTKVSLCKFDRPDDYDDVEAFSDAILCSF